MTWNHRKYCWAPFFSHLMDITMANTCVGNIQGHIMLTKLATIKLVRYEI
jgi:hypothetical protein